MEGINGRNDDDTLLFLLLYSVQCLSLLLTKEDLVLFCLYAEVMTVTAVTMTTRKKGERMR
jgi:hypothetical protein